MSFRRFVSDRWQFLARLPFGLGTLLAFVIGTVALGGSVAVFGAATEDVTRHNGLALHDAARLRFFSDHRSAVLLHAAKVATDVGAVPMVAAIAVLAGLLLWWRGQRLAIALAPLVSFAVAAAAVAATKGIVARQRPPLTLHL